jgi:hypothetical protein
MRLSADGAPRKDPVTGEVAAFYRLWLCGLYSVESVPLKKPSGVALLLGLIPFAAMCFSVAVWDRIDPMIFGVPFNLAWLICWIVLSSLCMWAAYRVEAARHKKDGGTL